MSTLTLGEARAQIETDVNDVALQALIDDAEDEITVRVGSIDSQVDIIREDNVKLLFLTRKVKTITSIVEEVDGISTTLTTSDYVLREASRVCERLQSGTHPSRYWAPVITVSYVPQDDTKRWKQITIDLVKLALAYNAVGSYRSGDYSESAVKYDEERTALIDRLRSWSPA